MISQTNQDKHLQSCDALMDQELSLDQQIEKAKEYQKLCSPEVAELMQKPSVKDCISIDYDKYWKDLSKKYSRLKQKLSQKNSAKMSKAEFHKLYKALENTKKIQYYDFSNEAEDKVVKEMNRAKNLSKLKKYYFQSIMLAYRVEEVDAITETLISRHVS